MALEQNPGMAFDADIVPSERRKGLLTAVTVGWQFWSGSVLQLFKSFSFDLCYTLPLFCAAFPSVICSFFWDWGKHFSFLLEVQNLYSEWIRFWGKSFIIVIIFVVVFQILQLWKTEWYSPEFAVWFSLLILFTFLTFHALDLCKK